MCREMKEVENRCVRCTEVAGQFGVGLTCHTGVAGSLLSLHVVSGLLSFLRGPDGLSV